MKVELQDKLEQKYPILYQRIYCTCGDGWFDLLMEMSEKIVEIFPECVASQVKEKFGGLRFYINSAIPGINNVIHEYEKKSMTVCESCGKPGINKRWSGYWYKTLCEKCSKEIYNNKKA